MFAVDEATIEAIRRAFNEDGEWSAVVELRRHYPAVTDNARARLCVRTIASWRPIPVWPDIEGILRVAVFRAAPPHPPRADP